MKTNKKKFNQIQLKRKKKPNNLLNNNLIQKSLKSKSKKKNLKMILKNYNKEFIYFYLNILLKFNLLNKDS